MTQTRKESLQKRRKFYRKHRKQLLKVAKKRYKVEIVTIKGRARRLLHSAKIRAKKSGKKFNLDQHWLEEKLTEGTCEITGLPFSFRKPRKGYRCNPFAPSLERFRPKGGYTKSNVMVVIWAVNIAKWEWTINDFKEIITAIYGGLSVYD